MGKSVRTTVSIPEDQHIQLMRVAESNHVSAAWVIREAIREYLRGSSAAGPKKAAPAGIHAGRKGADSSQ